MKRGLPRLLLGFVLLHAGLLAADEPPQVHGFGHGVRGGLGGRVLEVTRLDDDPAAPQPGMLRWALQQRGRRVVRLAVAGELKLKERILVRHGELTLDGRDALGTGVTVRGGALEFVGCEQVILTGFRVRLGDENTLRRLRRERVKRPQGSQGLDCVSLHECRGVVLDHLSLSWSCDELLAVVRSQNVTVQWCLFAEPLGSPRLHPYGDRHAFGIIASASTLTLHHCVLAHYWMRGPQFEANDVRRGDNWPVRMEAVSNLVFDFGRSGSRYTTGPEDHKDQAEGRRFDFQFLGNAYINAAAAGPSLEVVTRHGVHPGVRVCAAGNWELNAERIFVQPISVALEDGSPLETAPKAVRAQQSPRPLFRSPHPAPLDLGGAGIDKLLREVGCSHARDKVDRRVVTEILAEISRPVIRSQREVGGNGWLSRLLARRPFR